MTAEVQCSFSIDKSVDILQILSVLKKTTLDIYDFLTDIIKGHWMEQNQ